MIFRQGDPAHGHLTLGYGPATIGEAGCLLTADAQVLLHYGFSVNPQVLNDILKAAGRWINGDLLSDAAISGLAQFPGVKFVTKWDFTKRAADLSVLTNNANDEYIIELDFDHNPNDGIQTHFVRFVSFVDGKLIIDDPEYGTEDDFTKHYGTDLATTILKIVKYNGPAAATADPAPVTPAPTAEVTAQDMMGTAHVIAPANVRTGPGTTYPINDAHTAGGKLAVGTDFEVTGEVVGEDPYGDGRNKWVKSQYGNYVWEGNLTLNIQAGKGGGTAEPVSDRVEPPAEKAAEPAKPAAPAELTEIGYNAWLKPALNDETRTHEGAPVIDLDTMKPVEVFSMEAKAAFVAYRTFEGHNYFVTQHMLDNKLNYGIDGLNLQAAEQPGKVMPQDEAVNVLAEQAADDKETSVEDATAALGAFWSPLVKFLEKHHPNKKETK